MQRQYNPQHFHFEIIGGKSRAVGATPIGAVRLTSRGKVLVLAWLPREIHYPKRSYFNLRSGHLAIVRNLATGRTQKMAEQYLMD